MPEKKEWGRYRCPHCGEMITRDYLPRAAHFKECAPTAKLERKLAEERRLAAEAQWIEDVGWSSKQ